MFACYVFAEKNVPETDISVKKSLFLLFVVLGVAAVASAQNPDENRSETEGNP